MNPAATARWRRSTPVRALRPPSGVPRSTGGLLLQSLREDLAAIPFRLAVNVIAGHPVMPRCLRWMIYRVFRLGVMTPNVYAGCTFVARNVQIGAGTFVNRGCLFEGAGPLIIGRDCQIAMEAMFLTSTHPWIADGRFARASRKPHNHRRRPVLDWGAGHNFRRASTSARAAWWLPARW